MNEPGFWDDQAARRAVSTEHARHAKRVERYERLEAEYEDAAELRSSTATWRRDRPPARAVAAEVDRLREEALFNGEYDAGDAVVSIQAGAGGTDAQDWAEMLLRMYLRWADRRGFARRSSRPAPAPRPA